MKIQTNAIEVAKDFDTYEVRFFKTIRQTIALHTEKIVTRAVGIIKSRDVISTGDLFKSITAAVSVARDEVLGVVGSNLPYALYVHEGTRPHWPNVGAIQKWVNQQIRRGKMSLGPGETAKGRAFLVGRGISRRGTKGTKFLAIALRLQQAAIVKAVAEKIGILNTGGAK